MSGPIIKFEGLAVVLLGLLLAVVSISVRGPLGLGDGMVVWDYHYLSAAMTNVNGHIFDPLFGSWVSVPDSPALTALRYAGMAFPGPLVNCLVASSLVGFGVGFVLLASRQSIGRLAAFFMAVLLLALPIGIPWRSASPFDLWPALIVSYMALKWGDHPLLIAVAAVAAAFLNIANGVELAAMLLILRLSGYHIALGSYLSASIAGVASCVIFAMQLHEIAPGMLLREAYWSTDDVARIIGAEGLPISYFAIVVFVALIAAALAAFRKSETNGRVVRLAIVAAVVGLSFGLPEHLGGVPVLAPATALAPIMPQGWPSARILQLIVIAMAFPAAVFVENAFGWLASRFPTGPHIAAAGACLAVLGTMLNQPYVNPLGRVPAGANVIEFPIGESGSLVGLAEQRDLLLSGRRVWQPSAYVSVVSAVAPHDRLDDPAMLRKLYALKIRDVIVRDDYYARPRWRTERNQIFEQRDSLVPDLGNSLAYSLEALSTDYKIFRVR